MLPHRAHTFYKKCGGKINEVNMLLVMPKEFELVFQVCQW
jgi:hypothetical protein